MVDQGSAEWLEMRRGLITASKFKDAIAKGSGATRKAYMYKLAAERITGEVQESFKSSAMEWGNETEPMAREYYELVTGNTVEADDFKRLEGHIIGCSPDGLVNDDGLIEIKCPNTTTQIETFLKGEIPTIHRAQVQGQLWIYEREWCDFVSFDPRIDGKSTYFCKRVMRDDGYIAQLKIDLFKFEDDLHELCEKLT